VIRPLRILAGCVIFALFVVSAGRAIDYELALSEGEPMAVRVPAGAVTPASVSPVTLVAGRTVQPASPSLSAHQTAVKRIICTTFGPECGKALRVAWCESRFSIYAVGNRYGADPYYGLFQFGAYARRTYGFAWDARVQARAAKRMRDREGWRPWPVCGRL
jgi:hypothetical protein